MAPILEKPTSAVVSISVSRTEQRQATIDPTHQTVLPDALTLALSR
jgi:hypothetical protein